MEAQGLLRAWIQIIRYIVRQIDRLLDTKKMDRYRYLPWLGVQGWQRAGIQVKLDDFSLSLNLYPKQHNIYLKFGFMKSIYTHFRLERFKWCWGGILRLE